MMSAKSLPVFSGEKLEWLRFKQAFELSTELGGYSDLENVARLFEALKGEAEEAVDSLMVTACDAQTIMKTFELQFSNPDKIVEKIIHGVKKLPKVNTNRFDLGTFAAKVRNAVAAMRALNKIGHLHNPDLIREIVSKMPSARIYNYNHYSNLNRKNQPKLFTLSEFLYQEAEMASAA